MFTVQSDAHAPNSFSFSSWSWLWPICGAYPGSSWEKALGCFAYWRGGGRRLVWNPHLLYFLGRETSWNWWRQTSGAWKKCPAVSVPLVSPSKPSGLRALSQPQGGPSQVGKRKGQGFGTPHPPFVIQRHDCCCHCKGTRNTMKTNGAKFWFPLGLPTRRTSPIWVWAKGSACCTQGLWIRLNGTENKQENVPLEILPVPSKRLKVSPAWATGPHVIRVSIPASSQLTAQTPSPTTFSLVTFLTQVVLAVQLPGMLPPQGLCTCCSLSPEIYSHGSCFPSLQVFVKMPYAQRPFPATWFKIAPISPLPYFFPIRTQLYLGY